MNTIGNISEEVVSPELISLDQNFFPTPWTQKQWLELNLGSHTIYGLRKEGKLVGFALLWTLDGDNVAHLLKILLLTDSRGTGASVAFWSAIVENLLQKGFESVYLEVEAQNVRARSFYEKVGFKVLRRIKAYYSSGEDALTMSLTLQVETL
jgi:ribosomal protein S18 acetylase RimI-like enzyme